MHISFLFQDKKAQPVAELCWALDWGGGPMHFTYVLFLLTQALLQHERILGEEAIPFS